MSKTSFTSLPEEIIQKIAQHTAGAGYFGGEPRKSTSQASALYCIQWIDHELGSLASVNSDLRRICQPILYSGIHIQVSNVTFSCHALNIALQLAVSRQDIAVYVR
jgi:hypothetical protein